MLKTRYEKLLVATIIAGIIVIGLVGYFVYENILLSRRVDGLTNDAIAIIKEQQSGKKEE